MFIDFYKTNLLKIIIIIILLVVLCACKANKSEIKKVNTYKVINDMNNNYKIYSGSITSQNRPTLSFRIEGKIIYFPYTQGDFIKKGNTIAKIDNTLYDIEKKQIQAQLQEADISYTKAKKYYSRMDMLHKAGGISDNDWEDAYYALQTDRENINIQRQKLKYINEQISYSTIYAPFDGVIETKYKEKGDYIQAFEPILNFIENNKTQVEIMVEDDVINTLKIGQIVTAKQKEQEFTGRIYHISKSSQKDGGYLVKIILNNAPDTLLEGMSVDVFLANANQKKSIFIPISCTFEKDNESYVYKIVNIENNFGKISPVRIETNEVKDNTIEVLKGLNIGDIIIQGGLSNLKEGTRVSL